MPQMSDANVVRRSPRALTPEEADYFRRAAEEEESDPEAVADLERCWQRDCRVPLAQLSSAGVLRLPEIVAALKSARDSRGMTLETVSAASGIGIDVLAAVESGEDEAPSPRTLQRYAAAVGLRIVTGLVPIDPDNEPAAT